MPTEQGLGPDDERGPPASGHRHARSHQKDPVEAVESRAGHLPLQHLHLMPEHRELDLPPIMWASSGPEDAANEEVHEQEQHGAPFGSRGGTWLLTEASVTRTSSTPTR
jgi:hypothetical protein